MKKQIIFIHGGGYNDTYKEYLSFLRKYKLDVSKSKNKKWKDCLEKYLGSKFEIIFPQMPNSTNAKYLEWKIWFEKFSPYIKDDLILIGHSLGGIFLVKYLSENVFPKKIKALFLVAPSYSTRPEKYSKMSFDFKISKCKNISKQCHTIHIYHSTDDSIVSFTNFQKYKKCLPNATFHKFTNRGHFLEEKFPEIIKDLKSI